MVSHPQNSLSLLQDSALRSSWLDSKVEGLPVGSVTVLWSWSVARQDAAHTLIQRTQCGAASPKARNQGL